MYTFKISYNATVNAQVYPRYSDDLDKVSEKSKEYAGSRVELSSSLTFIGDDYNRIVEADYGTVFYITIDRGIYKDYFKGKFTINDCNVDKDMNMLSVKLTTNDEYKKIDEIYTTDVLLNELELGKIKVNYKRNILIQTYVTNNIEGDSYVTNHQGGIFWEQSCTPSTAFAIANSSEWVVSSAYDPKAFCYTDTPYLDFNGTWQATDIWNTGRAQTYLHSSGNYEMQRYFRFGSFNNVFYWWELKDLRADVVTWISEELNSGDDGFGIHDITKFTFVQVGNINILYVAEEKIIFSRALIDDDSSSIPDTEKYVNPQAFCQNEQYTNIIIDESSGSLIIDMINEVQITVSKDVQINPTIYNVNPDGKYFKKNESATDYDNYPLALNYWGWFSIWIQSSADLITAQYEYDTDTFTYGYTLGSIIDGILAKFNVDKQFISDFFSNTNNPIGSDVKTTPILTEVSNMSGIDPKNNILAKNGKLSLSKIMGYLESYGLKWDLTDTHFRVEHDFFYKNGESYSAAPGVGIDLVDKTSTRNLKSWAYGKNQYTIDDLDEKKYIEYEVDECSDFFLTSKIELDIQNEESDQVRFDGFISDVAYINAMSAEIKSSGSFAFLLIDSSDNILYKSFFAKGTTINAQNLQASLPYTSNKYLRYNHSPANVDIDDNTVAVEGYFRPVIQEVTYPLVETESDPNMNRLVKTDLGNGFIIKNIVNLPYRYCKIILRHEY